MKKYFFETQVQALEGRVILGNCGHAATTEKLELAKIMFVPAFREIHGYHIQDVGGYAYFQDIFPPCAKWKCKILMEEEGYCVVDFLGRLSVAAS